MCFQARKSLLGNAMRLLLIWGSDLPKPPFWGWIGIFKPNSKNSKTCIGLLSKLQHRSIQILHSDKDHQMPFEGGPSTRITNSRWRMAAILKEKSKNRHISARVLTIAMKFGTLTHTDPRNPVNR